MRRQMKAAVLTFFAGAVLILCQQSATGQQNRGAVLDGRWWLSISPNERTGFLDGYFDCYTYEFKGPDRFSSSTDTYSHAITHFYKKGESFELSDLVSDLLHKFRDPQGRIVIDKYAEHSKRPHGGNDGLYWRQMSADTGPEVEQRGFIEGYLACHSGLSHNKNGAFSKSAATYVELISHWYGFNRETDDIDAKREPTAIADVLFKFRDQHQK